jgi:hypothetical protein
MSSLKNIFLGVSLTICLQISEAHSQPLSQDSNPAPHIQRGVTADQVRDVTINNNLARPHDADRERIAAMMVRYLQQAAAAHAAASANARHFFILQDPRDLVFQPDTVGGHVFVFVAGDSEDIELSAVVQAPKCVFQDGMFMAGLVVHGTVSSEVQFRQEFVGVDHPLFMNLCDSLGQDARTSESGARPNGDPITNFDVLSDGDLPLVFTFFPSHRGGVPFEVATAREFWLGAVSAVSPFQMAEVAQRELVRRYGRARVAAMEAEAQNSGELSASLDLRSLGMSHSVHALRELTRRDFGRHFGELEDAWVGSLRDMHVAIGGERRRMSTDGTLAPGLPRFSVAEVGTPSFWRHVSDVGDFTDSITCAAVRFAVERDYARARDLPNYADCVSANIRALRMQRE